MRSIEPTESQIQCAIVEWANNTNINNLYGKIGDYLFAIPNGGKRSITEAVRLKMEGVKAGVSDLFLAWVVKDKDYDLKTVDGYVHIINKSFRCGIFIEVKKLGGKISESQKKWISLTKFVGHYDVVVVYSVDQGIQAIKDYLGMR